MFVANLSSCPLSSVDEFDTIYACVDVRDDRHGHLTEHLHRRATAHRSVGATKLNHASSRSHAVLTIEVTMTEGDRSKLEWLACLLSLH